MMALLEITLQRRPRPRTSDPDELIDYLLSSLGFGRNREVYREIILKLIHNKAQTSGQLSQGIAKRTTTIYHIGKLVRSGILVRDGSRYLLREPSFELLIGELKRDVDRLFEDLLEVARRLDEMLGR